LTPGGGEPILSRVEWRWYPRQANRPVDDVELPLQALDNLRLFPIVGPALCLPVADLLARGRLEEVAALVSDRAWVASAPLYG
jgi:hypothetical protein